MVLCTIYNHLDGEALSSYSPCQYNFLIKKEKNKSVNSNNENQQFTCESTSTCLNWIILIKIFENS